MYLTTLGTPLRCSSAIAPRQLLLRCPTTVHPWTYALPYYLPSMAVYADFPNYCIHMKYPG